MSRRHLVTFASLLLPFGAGFIGPLFACHSEQASNKELLRERALACEAQTSSLEVAVSDTNVEATDVRARVLYGALDYHRTKACLGQEWPVDTKAADRCWQQTHKQGCYVGVARQLAVLYRGQQATWKHSL